MISIELIIGIIIIGIIIAGGILFIISPAEKAKKKKHREKIEPTAKEKEWEEKCSRLEKALHSLRGKVVSLENTISDKEKQLLEEKAQTKMNASRDQRRDELSKMNENWGDFVVYLKSNPGFRAKLGLDLEKNRLGIKEEFIRLSQLHEYADGEVDYPVFNSDVVESEFLLNSLEEENNDDN